MAARTVVTTVCDVHDRRGEEVCGTPRKDLKVKGQVPDLCDPCYKKYAAPLVEVLTAKRKQPKKRR